MDKYHISENNQVLGIYSLEELKHIPLNNETLIWKKGMNEWKKASEVEELKIILNHKEVTNSLTVNNTDSEYPPAIPSELKETISNKKVQIPFINKSISPVYLTFLIIFTTIIVGVIFFQLTKVSAEKIPLSDIKSHILYQKENGRACIEEYEILIRKNTKSCEAYYLLANLYHITFFKSVDVIKINLLKSLELKPSFLYSNLLLAQIYFSEQNLAAAKTYAIQAQNIDKNEPNLQILIAQIQKTETQLLEKEILLEKESLFNTQKEAMVGEYYQEEKIYSQTGQGYIYMNAHLIINKENEQFNCVIESKGILPNGEILSDTRSAYLDKIVADDYQLKGIIIYSDGAKGDFKWDGNSRFLISTLKNPLFPNNPEYLIYYKK